MVFKIRPKQQQVFPIAATLGLREVKGDVGLEIEVEGNKFKKTELPKPWVYHKDNSLRGEDNAEYIFANPRKFSDVPGDIDALWKMFKDYGSVLDDSNRTSVHVHLNVQDFFLDRFTTFLALYITFEEILTEWCGEHRVGNLFCLRAKDAPAIIQQARQFIRRDLQYDLREGLHYAGMSIYSVPRQGSVEIRCMSGTQDPSLIKEWVSILQRLYERSGVYESPDQYIETFSYLGPMRFMDEVFGDKVPTIRKRVEMSDADIRESLYEGIRMAQDLCYCRDWGRFNHTKLAPDPFKRSPRTVINHLRNLPLEEDQVNPEDMFEPEGDFNPARNVRMPAQPRPREILRQDLDRLELELNQLNAVRFHVEVADRGDMDGD